MRMLRGWWAAAAVLVAPAWALAQEDLSSGGEVQSDLWQSAESPPVALLDGDDSTHFCQHRLEHADWRIRLGRPGVLERLSLVQGWPDWSQALEIQLETAFGETATLTLAPGTRDSQSFDLSFAHPTAFVDVLVVRADPGSGSSSGYGGFAEMRLEGTPVDSAGASVPLVSGIAVDRESDSAATVSWTTDRPASSQVRYSTRAVSSQLTPSDPALVTEHSVHIDGSAPLSGVIEIRSADESGQRAEVRHDAFVTIDTDYQYGVGGWSFPIGGEWISAPELFATDDLQVRFVQSWIGGSGWTEWFTADSVRTVADGGYTPEVIHYYFGDPVLEDVIARQDAFLGDIETLAQILAESGVGDSVLVTLEPEFNQGEVATWEGWNDLMIQAIDILRSTAGCKVGLLPGDWDIDHVLPISMGRAAAYADFVAFQEMRASTQNDQQDALGVPDRAVRFSHYLSRTFMRPVRLGYLMVSDYGGWSEVQRQVVIQMCERHQELQDNGTVALSWMSYMDRPGAGGYFGPAEAHKGLKDENNAAKPAWHVFRECAAHGPSWLDSGEPPPGDPGPGERMHDDGCGCRVVASGRRSRWGWLLLGTLLAAGRRGSRRWRAQRI